MTFEEFRKTLSGKLVDIVVGGVGFLLALLINSYIADRSDDGAYRALLAAVRVEAAQNEKIARDARHDTPPTISARELSDAIVLQAMSNPLFIRHVPAERLPDMGAYITYVDAMNTFRRSNEANRFSALPENQKTEHDVFFQKNWLADSYDLIRLSKEIQRF